MLNGTELYPLDTVQSRLPDPDWLEHWLNQQICFDKTCEARVERSILSNLSTLFDQNFRSAGELNRYRKELSAESAR